jgi:NADH-quinone oxidoreductase subunit D
MAEYREVTMDDLRGLVTDRAITGETVLLNMGPQHPSTHGVLRLLLELDGEIVLNCIPDIGFLHTGVEKNMESKIYQKAEVMTDRLDYTNTIGNNLAFCLALEKLLDLDVPERAEYVRVILTELSRINSHLIWLGTSCLDLAAMSVFLYTFRERELILDIFELCSGQRMMTTYIRPGGLWRDVPVEFVPAVQHFLDIFPRRIEEYDGILHKNKLFQDRTKGIGLITAEECIQYGVTGPILRGSGRAIDFRRARPYSVYDRFDFDIPCEQNGDIYDRYLVRMEELRQSTRIIEQALHKMPVGPTRSSNNKVVPPPRSEIGISMEALIHHFKLWTEGFCVPKGSAYQTIETPRGLLGVYMESDGSPKPLRVHYHTPSRTNLQAMTIMTRNRFLADVVGIIGSVDIVLGDADR